MNQLYNNISFHVMNMNDQIKDHKIEVQNKIIKPHF